MVVKIMKWPAWPPAPIPSKKFQVKVKPIKLEGFKGCEEEVEEEGIGDKVVMVEIRWKGSKVAGLVALRRSSKQIRNVSAKKFVKRGDEVIEWDDEFDNVCCFTLSQKHNPFIPFDVSLNLLYGKSTESRNKLMVIGTVKLNVSELATQMDPQIERKLPITLQFDGVSSEATLLISVSFIEIRDSQESQGIVQDGSELTTFDSEAGFFRRVKDLTSYVSTNKKKRKEKKIQDSQDGEVNDETGLTMSCGDTDESTTFDSESGSPDNELCSAQKQLALGKSTVDNESSTSIYYNIDVESEASSMTQSGTSPGLKTRSDSVSKVGFLSWKKRRLSFRFLKTKEEPLLKKTNGVNGGAFDDSAAIEENAAESSKSDIKGEEATGHIGSWEEKEFCSRDAEVKLKTNVFFASMDQRSSKAAGEGACTVLVAVIADWLQSHRDVMPPRSEFDKLITEGSLEWRKLCDNVDYLQCFPDKHFDLDTVLQADLRPLAVKPDKSFIGFFGAENFESLKGVMSFDGIWDKITSNMEDGETTRGVYIVSWNDHFFVLVAEANEFYIIDTLGERLFEGCDKAYILKFDDTSLIYRLSEKERDGSKKVKEVGKEDESSDDQREREELVCKGKECCKEFIKRFLAAIPLRELEVEEKKGKVSTISLHQRLQIEFHYSSSSSSSSFSSDEGV